MHFCLVLVVSEWRLLYTVDPMFVCMYVWSDRHHISKGKDQPGKIANPARGQLNRENKCFAVPVRA